MLLKGKPVADILKEKIIKEVDNCITSRLDVPKLAILRAGDKQDDISYEASILKNCELVGIKAKTFVVDDNINMVNFMEVLKRLNKDPKIHGILIFRPLPEQLDIEQISRAINPEKDIDCMNPVNIERIFAGNKNVIPPCTPEAVIEILKYYQYELSGKNVAIVNRSMVLGRPLSMLFLEENSTVTICHSKTKDLPNVTSKADIVVTGVGKGSFFGPEYFSKKAIILDVGINFRDGNLCGDVDFDAVSENVAAITPVPSGVGTVTSMILLYHVVKAMRMQMQNQKNTKKQRIG